MGDTAADGSKNTESRKAWGREKRGQKVNTISNPLTHHNTPTAPKVTPGYCTGAANKTIPKKKKCEKAKWLSEEALKIAEER